MSSAASYQRSGQDTYWDQQPEKPVARTVAHVGPSRKQSETVVDDWEAEEDEEDDAGDVYAEGEEKEKVGDSLPETPIKNMSNPESEAAIWEAANTFIIARNAQAPAPKIDIVPSTSLRPGAVVPPPEVFQVPIRILRRPDAKKESATQALNALSREEQEKQLKDKEAEYLRARERIFAASSLTNSSTNSDNEIETAESRAALATTFQGNGSPVSNSIVRNPKGPPTNGRREDTPSRGFRGKRGKRISKRDVPQAGLSS